MFTIFDDRLDAFARRTLDDHRRFDAGGWNPEELAAYQLRALGETLRYVTERSPFYRELLGPLGVSAPAELTFDSFAELPFTTKDDLRGRLHDMLSRPVHEGWIFYETTGTTGRATPCPRDNVDSLVNNTALSVCYDHVFRAHGGDHVIGVMGPNELHSTGDTFGDVCRNLGHAHAKMWPHSPVVGFRRALEVLQEISVTGVFCTPNVAMSMAKEAVRAGLEPKDLGIRFFMFTGELATPGLLSNIGELWGATAYNCLYASQEASILGAVHGDGRLRTVPLNVYYELIDPGTGRPVPRRDGYRQGELVITHLYQGSKPLVRYRTGDLVRLYPADTTGGRYPSEVLLPLGRVRDLIDLNGHEVTAYELESLILSRLAGAMDYQLVIDRVDGTDTLTVEVETRGGATLPPQSAADLVTAARDAWDCPLEVAYGQLGGVTTTGAMVSWKAARVHDRRQAPDAERQAALAMAGRRSGR
ncbi:phenylacetate--CoA ligase family protein [Streptomyces griseoluteus]|uniref:Phenylacetate--CoA ligase family protein n=1 Tax=Streptomyces griseoluteus TaxID=29306 RepID=A0A4Z1D1S7_STRGP|nr:phenylacetate--CoA ligase family protein [Streptomyces griseoluteus]TGN75292.1 phenylacetate--CoA ligase family protein [Streptomyces griseoluteus]GHF30989.1 phenylacetate--CoA ligase [Streptomyces griseoluteus]